MVRKFDVVIEKGEDGYFVASVPAIPGCYTQAKTKPELMRRIKDAIALCIEAGDFRSGKHLLFARYCLPEVSICIRKTANQAKSGAKARS